MSWSAPLSGCDSEYVTCDILHSHFTAPCQIIQSPPPSTHTRTHTRSLGRQLAPPHEYDAGFDRRDKADGINKDEGRGSSAELCEGINMDWLIGKHSSETDGYTRPYLLSDSVVCFSPPRHTQLREISQDPCRRCLLLLDERQQLRPNSVALLRHDGILFCFSYCNLLTSHCCSLRGCL